MFFMTRNDEEEEKEDEDASIADDMLEEIEDGFVDDLEVDPVAVVAPVVEEEDEEDVDFDAHDDVDPI